MDAEIFVQNIKKYCKERGIKPTPACIKSGVGKSFISNIEKGQIPSVEKVSMLAAYLGVTTSELLGEQQSGPTTVADDEAALDEEIIQRLMNLSPEERIKVDGFVQGLLASRSKPASPPEKTT